MKSVWLAVIGFMLVFGAPAEAQTAKRDRAGERAAPSAEAMAKRAARVERMFRLADRNRDGVISRTEYRDWYRAAARRRGPLTWRRHAAQMFRQLDAAADGRLTQAEFAADPFFRRTRPGWWGPKAA